MAKLVGATLGVVGVFPCWVFNSSPWTQSLQNRPGGSASDRFLLRTFMQTKRYIIRNYSIKKLKNRCFLLINSSKIGNNTYWVFTERGHPARRESPLERLIRRTKERKQCTTQVFEPVLHLNILSSMMVRRLKKSVHFHWHY